MKISLIILNNLHVYHNYLFLRTGLLRVAGNHFRNIPGGAEKLLNFHFTIDQKVI